MVTTFSVFGLAGARITVETNADGEILSVTDSHGNTWARQPEPGDNARAAGPAQTNYPD